MDIVGAVAVLNTGSWDTYPAIIVSHQSGDNSFAYNVSAGQRFHTPSDNRYFLENSFEFIDMPTEWLYNKTSGMAYMIPEDGRGPYLHQITGKVSTYALNITNCSYVTIGNLTFFATTIWSSGIGAHGGHSDSKPMYVDHLTVHSVNFSHPSYSRRMLNDVGAPMWTVLNGLLYHPESQDVMGRPLQRTDDVMEWYDSLYAKDDVVEHGFNAIINCSWTFTDGPALDFHGTGHKLINNLFAYNDWSGADEVHATGGVGTVNCEHGFGGEFSRNTLYMNGGMTGLTPPPNSTVQFNHITGQCWGDIQHDGAGIQVMAPYQHLTTISHNWVHDSVKYAVRFDGQPPKAGTNGTLYSNVGWKTGGFMVKGDYHTVLNNLAFDLRKENVMQIPGQNCSLCVPGYLGSNPVPMNKHTATANNAGDFINGGTGDGGHGKNRTVHPLPGYALDNIQARIRDEVLDADNYDFRPRKNSTFFKYGGVGPYPPSRNHTMHYWIPGCQMRKATTPIPPDSSKTVKTNRNSVMWLTGQAAQTSQVQFLSSCASDGGDRPIVSDAIAENGAIHYEKDTVLWSSEPIPATQNVYNLPTALKSKQRYCWQVNTVTTRGETVVGDVWTFTTV